MQVLVSSSSWLDPLYLIGMRLGKDQITNIIKTTCLKDSGLHFQILWTTLHSIMNTSWEDLCIQLKTPKMCASITITNQEKSGFQSDLYRFNII